MAPYEVLPSLAGASYAIPVLGALKGRPRSLPLRLLAVYCFVALVESWVMIYLSGRDIRNVWMIHLFTPFEAAMFLWAFSRWQVRELARLTILLSIPMFLVLWAFLTLSTESLSDFPVYGKSAEAILIVAVAAYTLVIRASSLVGPLTRHPWFWVSLGTLVYFPFLAVLNPISSLLLPHSWDLVIGMFQVNAVLGASANLLFARAMLCHQPQLSSGGSSSLQPSLASS